MKARTLVTCFVLSILIAMTSVAQADLLRYFDPELSMSLKLSYLSLDLPAKIETIQLSENLSWPARLDYSDTTLSFIPSFNLKIIPLPFMNTEIRAGFFYSHTCGKSGYYEDGLFYNRSKILPYQYGGSEGYTYTKIERFDSTYGFCGFFRFLGFIDTDIALDFGGLALDFGVEFTNLELTVQQGWDMWSKEKLERVNRGQGHIISPFIRIIFGPKSRFRGGYYIAYETTKVNFHDSEGGIHGFVIGGMVAIGFKH